MADAVDLREAARVLRFRAASATDPAAAAEGRAAAALLYAASTNRDGWWHPVPGAWCCPQAAPCAVHAAAAAYARAVIKEPRHDH